MKATIKTTTTPLDYRIPTDENDKHNLAEHEREMKSTSDVYEALQKAEQALHDLVTLYRYCDGMEVVLDRAKEAGRACRRVSSQL
jgi:hypothetical protein